MSLHRPLLRSYIPHPRAVCFHVTMSSSTLILLFCPVADPKICVRGGPDDS